MSPARSGPARRPAGRGRLSVVAALVLILVVGLCAALGGCSRDSSFDRAAAIDRVLAANDGALTRSQAECYVDRVTAEVGVGALDTATSLPPDKVPQVVKIQIDCVGVVNLGTTAPPGTASTTTVADPDAIAEPQGFGDDPHLDDLYDACRAGDGAVCDQLFSEAPPGSRYEDFASTCGGRTKEASCAATYPGPRTTR